MRKIYFRILSVVAVLALAIGSSVDAQADSLITNGSFEDTTISVWDITPGLTGLGGETGNLMTDVTGWTGVAATIAGSDDECRWYVENSYVIGTYSGTPDTSMIETPYGRLMFALGGYSSIYQDFEVTIGNEYTVSYYEVNREDSIDWPGVGLTADITGVAATGTLSQFANTDIVDGWTLYSFSFAPTEDGTARLTFTGAEQRGGMLDEVSVTAVSVSTPIAGDANNDGKVDGSDVTILAGNWQAGVDGTIVADWAMGDFNADGKVDGSDVTILAGNWQAGVTAAATAVPEPSTLVLLLGGLLFLVRRR